MNTLKRCHKTVKIKVFLIVFANNYGSGIWKAQKLTDSAPEHCFFSTAQKEHRSFCLKIRNIVSHKCCDLKYLSYFCLIETETFCRPRYILHLLPKWKSTYDVLLKDWRRFDAEPDSIFFLFYPDPTLKLGQISN